MMVMPGKIKFIDAYILTRFLLQETSGLCCGYHAAPASWRAVTPARFNKSAGPHIQFSDARDR
jgi:hypothetical protein